MASCHARAVMLRRKEYRDEIDYNIALAIANHMGSDGRPATVSIATIATYAGCHYNTADKRTKTMAEAGQVVIGRSGRFFAYSVPFDGNEGEAEGTAAVSEVAELRAEVAELREQVAQLTAAVAQLSHDLHMNFTRPSHELHMNFTPAEEGTVNKVRKCESSEELLPPEAAKGRNKSARQQAQDELEKHFSAVSGLPVPKRNTEKERKAAAALWWTPLADMWQQTGQDIEQTKRHIAAVVAKMRRDGLTVSSPTSALKMFASDVAAEKTNGANGGNGANRLWVDEFLPYLNGNKPFAELSPLTQAAIREQGESVIKRQPTGVTKNHFDTFISTRH